ncbi:ABC transporter permease [Candidatus Pelagibacter communis]|mgnify:FL=1|uniref:Trimethylamine N-oxide transport system permease protein TmoV n=1 Tax=Pelagibacter ubique (strain HTCC1062) TaxID=335992 RepID=TMOV_PELUB|nr:ABC transporter permease subunit [Candidatus Pelagibacter ubique]Q4FL38.1 RecName: Full=Trimethylamine N-oxide transport system permease protein TmoV; Short=TMAO transport system permease protein TmoV [Candidatus Pelagibacter ubique HTCC1062]AAZ22100.1 glycine betaine/L-proline transport system permease [Candidatus Pelagibacter ubique HTCC1062]
MELLKKYPKFFQWLFLLIVFFSLCFAIEVPETYNFIRGQAEFIKDPNQSTYTLFGAEVRYYAFDVFWRLPPLLGWLPIWINDSLFFLMNEWMPMEFWNEDIQEFRTQPLLLQITRNLTSFMTFLIELIREILLGGVETIVSFSSWDWIDANPWAELPGLPWTIVTAGAVILGYKLSGKGLALFAGLVMIYISVFGQWKPSMQTLSFILVAAPLSFLFGLTFGVMAFKSKRVEKFLYPILLVMQTMPQYAVLVPAIVLFGIGDHAAVIITMVVAVPPMILLTLLGLRGIPSEVIEAGRMSGCNNWQLMTKVLIPTARRDILIGVNQVIMVCFSMAVISAFIGAKGLGFNLLLALNQLNIGLALEAGLCISLIAILLDKMSLAWANKQIDYFGNLTYFQRNKNILFFAAAVILGIIFSYLGSFYFKDGSNYLFEVPHNKGISTADFWNKGVDWIWDTFFHTLKIFNTWLIVDVLQPMRALYLRMPAVATLVLVIGAGYIIGGIRSALVVGGLTLFIALSPWWDRALVTLYMATFGVFISTIIGFTVGIISFQNKHTANFMLGVCDIFQTFPSFVYLIPVMMLFGVTDTSVLIAVIVYATIPATRYTIEGLRSVPEALHDAATMSGVNKVQRLLKIEFPLAFPHMMLGLNQTIVFALFMVIIGAFIGTEDLGQYILKALSDKKGAGIGLTLGLCVAFIGLIFDHLIRTWVGKRKKHLGIG